MPTLIDLTGKKFGRWTVLKRAPNKGKSVYWTCECECGTIKDVKGQCLREGESLSCGCYQKEKAAITLKETAKKNMKNISGQRFGNLVALYPTEKRDYSANVIWMCQCDCGNKIEVGCNRLVQNNITHCGCKAVLSKGETKIKQILLDNNILFTQQKTFNSCRYPNTNSLARFDFWVKDSYIVEFDGRFHSVPDNGWATEEKVRITQEHDKIKNEWAKNNNIIIIRIPWYHYDQLCLEDLLPETSTFIIK